MKIGLSKAYSTHNPILIRTVLASEGPVLELGSGVFSTPLLHWLCKAMGRKLFTYEGDAKIFNSFTKKFTSRDHRTRFIDNWDNLNLDTHWGIILMDHLPPARRVSDLIKFKDYADYIIVHDTDDTSSNWESAWKNFKYRIDWKDFRPWTTIVSNFKDPSKMEIKKF